MSGETYTITDKSSSSNSSANSNSQRTSKRCTPDKVVYRHSNHTFTILNSSNDSNCQSSRSMLSSTEPPLLSTYFHSCHSQEVTSGQFVRQRTADTRAFKVVYPESDQLPNTYTIESNQLQRTYTIDSPLSQPCACQLSNTYTMGPNGQRIFKPFQSVRLNEEIVKTAIVRPVQLHSMHTISHSEVSPQDQSNCLSLAELQNKHPCCIHSQKNGTSFAKLVANEISGTACTAKSGIESQSVSVAQNRRSTGKKGGSSSGSTRTVDPFVEAHPESIRNSARAASENLPYSSKDNFSSAEFLSDLANNKNGISPSLSQDPLFFIVSQTRAYDHFRVNLEGNSNAKISTQKNCPDRMIPSSCSHTGSSSETYFSPIENMLEQPHTASSNKLDVLDASCPKSARLSNIQEPCNSDQLIPVKKSSPKQTILNPIVLVSKLKVPGMLEASSSPKCKPFNDSDVASASSSLCTVRNVKSDGSQNENKNIKVGESEISENNGSSSENAANILNHAYIAEKSEDERGDSVSRRESQNHSESPLPGETSKHTSKSGSSSKKIHSSSTDSSSCIVESSVIDQSKKLTRKVCNTTFSKGGNNKNLPKSPEQKRTNNFGLSPNSWKKLPRRKRRRLFKKFKIVQRQKNKRIAEKSARIKKDLGSGSKVIGPTSHQCSFITIQTSTSSISSPSIVECSVKLEPLLKKTGMVNKQPLKQEATRNLAVSNKPSAGCSKSCQTMPRPEFTASNSDRKQRTESPTNSFRDGRKKLRSISPANSSLDSRKKQRSNPPTNGSLDRQKKQSCKSPTNSFLENRKKQRSESPANSSLDNGKKQRSESPANKSQSSQRKQRPESFTNSPQSNQRKLKPDSPTKKSPSRQGKQRPVSPANRSQSSRKKQKSESPAKSSWTKERSESPKNSSRISRKKRSPESPASNSGTSWRKFVSPANCSSSSQSNGSDFMYKSASTRSNSKKQVPVKSAVIEKSKIFRLRELDYFCLNISAIKMNQDFLESHGLLPKLCLHRCTSRDKKRKLAVLDCSVSLVDCKKIKISSPPTENQCRTDPRKNISVSSDSFSYFKVDPRKKIHLSSSKKEKAAGSDSSSVNERCVKNPSDSIPTEVSEQNSKNSKDTEKKSRSANDEDCIPSDRKLDEEAPSVSAINSEPETSTKLKPIQTSDTVESALTVNACLMQISPRISENIISAVCCHCNNLIPYGLAKTELASCETLWPGNQIPLCPSTKCNGRRLYWGVFKTKLVLKTEKGDYLIAHCATPHAENFFGCTVREFFEEPEHKQKIKERIAELHVAQKKREDIIFKTYNLSMRKNENQLRIRIVDTNVFDP